MRAALLAVLVALAACKGKKSEDAPPAGGTATPSSGKGPTAPVVPPAPDPAAGVKREAAAFLVRWTETQQKLDFDAYAALYEARTFRGVKRTSGGKVTEYDLAGWKKDRRRMFDKKFEIATEPLGVETWLDRGSKLKRGMVILRFVQRWRSGTYADHGVKALHVWRDPKGAMKITYEDLLNSEAGWDRVAADVADADLPPPVDAAAALALWKKLAPTGADYEDKLASIPDDPAVARPMALALLAGGAFACKNIVSYDECGDSHVEWGDLDPKAGFDDPCLRRRLAPWALGKIDDGDLAGLEGVLVAMAGMEPPEDELPKEVAAAVSGAPEDVRLAVWGALVDGGREEEVTVSDGLSEKALLAAAVEHGIDDAALELDDVRHLEQLAALLGSDRMSNETKATILGRIGDTKHPAVTAALVALTGGDCELAMEAALALDRQGDPSHLPRRRKGDSSEQGKQALCMLVHDPDAERREKRIGEFIGPDKVTINETVEDPWARMAEEDAGAPDEDSGAPEETKIDDVDDVIERLEAIFAGTSDWDTATLDLGGDDGGPLIDGFTYYRYNGCGC